MILSFSEKMSCKYRVYSKAVGKPSGLIGFWFALDA
jgi:hypothetical protein